MLHCRQVLRHGLLLRNCRGYESVFVAYLWRGMRVEKEEQSALLQLLSHLPSLSDDSAAFLLASGGRAEVELLPKPVSGPLCTSFCTVNLRNPNLRGFWLTLTHATFLSKNVLLY